MTSNDLTPRAQQVFALARQEADNFNHQYLGTEHMLLGLLKLGNGLAVEVLKKAGLSLEDTRSEVEKLVGRGTSNPAAGNIPFTPRCKQVFAQAVRESRELNFNIMGVEALLLGLFEVKEGPHATIFQAFKLNVDACRAEILKSLKPE